MLCGLPAVLLASAKQSKAAASGQYTCAVFVRSIRTWGCCSFFRGGGWGGEGGGELVK